MLEKKSWFADKDLNEQHKQYEEEQAQFAQKNPYLAGKKRYMDVYEELATNVNQWKAAFWCAMAFLGITVIICITLAGRANKVIPYVVEVDSIGQVFPVAPATKSDVDNRVIMSQIGQFITNSRMRVLDREAQMYFVKQSYRLVAQQTEAHKELNTYYINNIPVEATTAVQVKVISIISISKNTYSAEWEEKSETSNGTETRKFKGYFEVAVSPPTDVKNLITNPLGIYITKFRVTEEVL